MAYILVRALNMSVNMSVNGKIAEGRGGYVRNAYPDVVEIGGNQDLGLLAWSSAARLSRLLSPTSLCQLAHLPPSQLGSVHPDLNG